MQADQGGIYADDRGVRNMTNILIEFERGGSFVAQLLEKEAPLTCKAVLTALPIEGWGFHVAMSGDGIAIVTPNVKVDQLENAKTLGFAPGDIAYNPHVLPFPEGHMDYKPGRLQTNDITFVYGWQFVPHDSPLMQAPENLFARLQPGSGDSLAGVAKRIREKGQERLVMRRAD
jgi:hypothetical protein